MKKIVITNYKEFGDIPENKTLIVMGEEIMEAQDGYHTFKELYDHRIALFIVLCNLIYAGQTKNTRDIPWKSKVHFDGTSYDGWFIQGIGIEKGHQISYHLPVSEWDRSRAVAYDKSPVEWDGHTPADVIDRLYKLYL